MNEYTPPPDTSEYEQAELNFIRQIKPNVNELETRFVTCQTTLKRVVALLLAIYKTGNDELTIHEMHSFTTQAETMIQIDLPIIRNHLDTLRNFCREMSRSPHIYDMQKIYKNLKRMEDYMTTIFQPIIRVVQTM